MISFLRTNKLVSVLFTLLCATAALPAQAQSTTEYVYQLPMPGLITSSGTGGEVLGPPADPLDGLTLSNPTFPVTNMYSSSVGLAVLANNTSETVTFPQPDDSTVTNPFDTVFRFSAPETTCATSLAPGASCVIATKFMPYDVSTKTAALTLFTSVGVRQVHPSATAVGGFTSFSNDTIDFGATPVGVPVNRTVTLTNTGEGSLPIVSITVQNRTDYGPAPDFGQTNDCGTGLAPGASCTFNLTFTPGAPGVYDQYGAEVLVDHQGRGNARIYLGGVGE